MERKRTASETGTDGRNAIVALLVIQILLGYEWLASGLTKLAHGDFPGGLAGDLAERSKEASGWYRSFLDSAVIPHAQAFGYAIEIAELLTGLALVAAALVWLRARGRLGGRARQAVFLATAGAAAVGALMNVDFHLANGSPLPWPIAADSFDEAIDLDSVMAALELVLVGVGITGLVSTTRARNRSDQRREQRQGSRSRKEMIPVYKQHAHTSKLFLFVPLLVGLALGAALFGGKGGTASATPAQARDVASLKASLTQTQQDAKYWTQLTSVLKPAPLHLRSMQDHRLYMLPSGIVLGLHFDNMNLAKAKNLNWIVFGVPGRFTKADQARVTREFGPGFVHFHDFVHDTHGGKPGAKGFWFVHIGARNFRSPFAPVKDGAIDPTMMPTPPPR
jgi:uncharacterized membrane protein YphA (DoxX/SURF4 family)